jgi:hypothetical protein
VTIRGRLRAVQRRMGGIDPEPIPVADVPSFPPGPDAPEGSGFRVLLRDPKGNCRIIGSIREFYRLTAIKTPEACYDLEKPA